MVAYSFNIGVDLVGYAGYVRGAEILAFLGAFRSYFFIFKIIIVIVSATTADGKEVFLIWCLFGDISINFSITMSTTCLAITYDISFRSGIEMLTFIILIHVAITCYNFWILTFEAAIKIRCYSFNLNGVSLIHNRLFINGIAKPYCLSIEQFQ